MIDGLFTSEKYSSPDKVDSRDPTDPKKLYLKIQGLQNVFRTTEAEDGK